MNPKMAPIIAPLQLALYPNKLQTLESKKVYALEYP